MADIPSEEELLSYLDTLSNWGRWGEHDQHGTLNLVTEAKRRQSAGLVRLGRVVSCARPITTTVGPNDQIAGATPVRLMLRTGEGLNDPHRVLYDGPHKQHWASAADRIELQQHGVRLTHLDALSHHFWDAKMYNGRPAELVTARGGATVHDVMPAAEGVITRGVLLDVPAHRGVNWLERGEGVRPDELDAILTAHSLDVGPGDAVLLRMGNDARIAECGEEVTRSVGRAGWHAACLPWLRSHDIAIIGSDGGQDVNPCGYQTFRNPIHSVGIVAMGMWLIDNCWLESLAQLCAEVGVYEFQLILAPLAFVGLTGSPINPLAIL